jgi:hypothetical protein
MSRMASPALFARSIFVVLPIPWTMRVIVPAFVSPSTMVRGIRSPFSATRMMTKFPGLRFRAMNGASTTNLETVGESTSFCLIVNMVLVCWNGWGMGRV